MGPLASGGVPGCFVVFCLVLEFLFSSSLYPLLVCSGLDLVSVVLLVLRRCEFFCRSFMSSLLPFLSRFYRSCWRDLLSGWFGAWDLICLLTCFLLVCLGVCRFCFSFLLRRHCSNECWFILCVISFAGCGALLLPRLLGGVDSIYFLFFPWSWSHFSFSSSCSSWSEATGCLHTSAAGFNICGSRCVLFFFLVYTVFIVFISCYNFSLWMYVFLGWGKLICTIDS